MKRCMIALLLAGGAVASNAHALVYMTDENNDPIGSSHYLISYVGLDDEDIPIYDVIIKSRYTGEMTNSFFVIHGTGGENIGTVTVQVPTDGYLYNYVVIRVVSVDGTDGINDLYEVVQTTAGTEGAVLNRVKINGSVGSVSIDAIGDIIAGGDIIGPIESTGDHWNGGITKLQCTGTGSSILGDVTSAGSIKWIRANEGDIGEAGSPITISCTTLERFVKGENVYANITASSGDVGLIQATKTSGGELVAEISGQNIQNPVGSDGIVVNGDLDLTLTLSGGTNPSIRDHITITGGDFTADSSISAWGIGGNGDFTITRADDGMGGYVGGYFRGDIVFTGNLSDSSAFTIDEAFQGTINIGQSLMETVTIKDLSSSSEGLAGQIIVNSKGGSSVWETDATVTVDNTALSPIPYYNNKSDDLGGGAVGLAPYYCHYKDCTPRGTKVDEASNGEDGLIPCEDGYHAQLRVSPNAITSTVTIRHYGPVMQDGIGKPFEVWAKPIGTDPCDEFDVWNWTEVTSSFTHSFPAGDLRAIEITGPFADAHDYLIRPKTSGAVMLVCDGLTTSNTVPVKDYDYRIRVFYLQNLNMTGGLEAGDIATWLLEPADTTLDGTTDNDDLIDVIDAVAEYGE